MVFAAAHVAVAFERVDFGYADGDRPLLHDLELNVPAGSQLTLIGASGCGKSSLLNLLMGFIAPSSGRILVNGRDLAGLDLTAWRSHIAWVPQRAHVFHGTLRDNLLMAAPKADPLSLQRAIHATALGPVIARLPYGLDTPLGEGGHGLSGGERQRLALARAWLRNAPLLLLDEPTQHLDEATVAGIDAALARLGEGRTVIRIAHRLGSIADDEQVAVLADGRIVEQGSAAALRRQGGAFARLLAADRAA
jgi:ATP-binding cassette subfamily C protein CydD